MTLFLIGSASATRRTSPSKGSKSSRRRTVRLLGALHLILGVDKEKLEAFYGREIKLADRERCREGGGREARQAREAQRMSRSSSFGDPFGATTHTDLVLTRNKEHKVKIEGHPITRPFLNAVGVVGLELYKYGSTTSIPFWEPGFEPETRMIQIKENKARGLHTRSAYSTSR